jgi:hypothetical protein
MARLAKDRSGTAIQFLNPDPTKSSNDTIANTASKTLSVVGWTMIRFSSTKELQVKLNENTAYFPCYEDIYAFDGTVTQIVFTNNSGAEASISIMGM